MAQGSTSSGAGSRILIPALLITTVVTGLMAGFFYAYASSVMIGLADASDATFIEAMQQINANVRSTQMSEMSGSVRCSSEAWYSL